MSGKYIVREEKLKNKKNEKAEIKEALPKNDKLDIIISKLDLLLKAQNLM